MAREGSLQSRKQRDALFAQGRQVPTDTTKRISASPTAETPRNLLLELDHAHIPLRQIVVKIHTEIFQEAEKGLLVSAQAIEQIPGGTLFASTPCPGWGGGSWVGQIAFVKQGEKLSFPIHDLQGVKSVFALLASVLSRFFHIQEQIFEIKSPPAVLFFCQKDQFAQQMHVTTGVLTSIQEVRSPSIMDRDPTELWQNPNGFQCGLASVRMDLIVCQGGRAGDMHPMPFACHIQACFVLVDGGRLDQGVFDLLLHLAEVQSTALGEFAQGSFAHLHSQHLFHHLTCSCQWQQLLVDQVESDGSAVRSVLDGSLNSLGERSDGDLLTPRTLLLLYSVFLYDHTWRGDVHDLPMLDPTRRNAVQILLAERAGLHSMLNHFIWFARELQRRPLVSLLPTRFLLALFAQAFQLRNPSSRY